MKWKTLSSSRVIDNKWCHIRKDEVLLPNNRIVDDYFVHERPDVVIIFALTAEDEVVLVKQYKHAAGEVLTELPGGAMEEGEAPEIAAHRELLEETGFTGDNFIQVATFYDNPTKDTNRIYVFKVTNARRVAPPSPDPTENIETILEKKEKLINKIAGGEIKVSGSVAAIFMALR